MKLKELLNINEHVQQSNNEINSLLIHFHKLKFDLSRSLRVQSRVRIWCELSYTTRL
jgi:hypothetical protein